MATRPPNVVIVVGIDGSGKTTVSRCLVSWLEGQGRRAIYRWMRFNHLTVRAVNRVGRALGASYSCTYADGTVVGYHDYGDRPVLGAFYRAATVVDSILAALLLRLRARPNTVVVVDRFLHDTLVDMAVDLGRAEILTGKTAALFSSLLPRRCRLFLFTAPKEVILARRPSIGKDENLDLRLSLYSQLAEVEPRMTVLDTRASVEASVERIVEQLAQRKSPDR